MHRTIFTTPVVRPLLRSLARAALALAGWRVEGALTAECERCVLIAAPHTSNWDLPITLAAAFMLRLNLYWMGKQSIFRWPFGPLMRWLGGIAVNREQRGDMVASSVATLQQARQRLQLLVPPEGTRSRVRHWKTGFYYIALGAGVPIILAYMDYERRRVGLGPVFHPSGDIDADMARIRAFYAGIKGRHAAQYEA